MNQAQDLKVILVAENFSKKMGGEAGLNPYYFEGLKRRNIDVFVVCHGRVKEEIEQEFSNEQDFKKFYFIEDTWIQKLIWRISNLFPERIKALLFGQILFAITQLQARKIIRKLIEKEDIKLVFQPSPITPKGLNYLYDLGVPIVLGPLSGGLEFPPAFQFMDSKLTTLSIRIGRFLSNFLNILVPGKIKADVLIVANKKTEELLPKGCKGKINYIFDSGVDLKIWQPRKFKSKNGDEPSRFVFVGRFVDWKGVQFLVEAFAEVAKQSQAVLELVGDGELRQELEQKVKNLNLENSVNFYGYMKREECVKILDECDVFVMPSLREAGGNAILEAMAIGLPVIAANWAGPAQILDNSCGILVEPSSQEAFIKGLADAMIKLDKDTNLRQQMGEAGIKKIKGNGFDWDSKVEKVIQIFEEILSQKDISLS